MADLAADQIAGLADALLDLRRVLGGERLRLVLQFAEIDHGAPFRPSGAVDRPIAGCRILRLVDRRRSGFRPYPVDAERRSRQPFQRDIWIWPASATRSRTAGPLLADVTFRVGAAGHRADRAERHREDDLLRIITGELDAEDGAIGRSGGLGVMPQFIGSVRDDSTVRDLLLTVSPPALRTVAAEVDVTELEMMDLDGGPDDDAKAIRYAQALSDWADVRGYEQETAFDVACVAALGVSYDRAKYRAVTTLSGGEQKRLVLELLLAGPEEVLLLDEPDNYLDVPAKIWLEGRLAETAKAVLLISHDRELLARAATRIVTLEPGVAGAVSWVHGGSLATYRQARADRNSRLEELRRRWDEEHAKLKALVLMYKTKAAFNDGLASRYQAAKTRLSKFENVGPPQELPLTQKVTMRLAGGRTAKRAVVCTRLELTDLMEPFDLEV
ncbi:MAG: hypothetical protein WKF57_20280, partial [Nakamurella sp.]